MEGVMAGKFQMGTILALVFLLMLPAASEAFNRDLSTVMIDDAISFCPDNLREYLDARKALVLKGMKHGDYASGPIDPMSAERVYNLLIERLKQGKADDPNVIIAFGTLAFFLSETVSPGACRTLDALLPEWVLYDGTDPINNVEETILCTLELSKPFHGQCDEESMGDAYNVAVNVIVDFWIAVFNEAGMETGALLPVGSQVDHSRQAIYTPQELEAMRIAKEAREAAQAAYDEEMREMVRNGVITAEVVQWQKEQKEKKKIDQYIEKYRLQLKQLEEESDELRSGGTMDRDEVKRMRALNDEMGEIKSRISEFEDDPNMALEKERNDNW